MEILALRGAWTFEQINSTVRSFFYQSEYVSSFKTGQTAEAEGIRRPITREGATTQPLLENKADLMFRPNEIILRSMDKGGQRGNNNSSWLKSCLCTPLACARPSVLNILTVASSSLRRDSFSENLRRSKSSSLRSDFSSLSAASISHCESDSVSDVDISANLAESWTGLPRLFLRLYTRSSRFLSLIKEPGQLFG